MTFLDFGAKSGVRNTPLRVIQKRLYFKFFYTQHCTISQVLHLLQKLFYFWNIVFLQCIFIILPVRKLVILCSSHRCPKLSIFPQVIYREQVGWRNVASSCANVMKSTRYISIIWSYVTLSHHVAVRKDSAIWRTVGQWSIRSWRGRRDGSDEIEER